MASATPGPLSRGWAVRNFFINLHMQRREFLKISGLSLASLALTPLSAASRAESRGRSSYSVVILGDTHFDTEPSSVYHSNYNEPVEWLNRVQRAEFARNGEMWRERCPRLLARAASLVDADTALAIQVGDLVQGDCGSGEVHARMLTDVMNRFKAELCGLPFVTVAGNHDIRGVDAKKTYREIMPRRMSEELGQEITKTTFSFRIGRDVFIVIDFNSPDIAEIHKLLDRSEYARHTFILTHGGVFPYDGGSSRWFLLGSRKDTEERLRLRTRLAARKAIVLCGHSHFTELLDWRGENGRITQMTFNSVWKNQELGQYSVRTSDISTYGKLRLGKLMDNGKPVDDDPIYDEYRSGIRCYVNSLSAGSYKLNVSGSRISVDFYAGDSEKLSKRFILR